MVGRPNHNCYFRKKWCSTKYTHLVSTTTAITAILVCSILLCASSARLRMRFSEYVRPAYKIACAFKSVHYGAFLRATFASVIARPGWARTEVVFRATCAQCLTDNARNIIEETADLSMDERNRTWRSDMW